MSSATTSRNRSVILRSVYRGGPCGRRPLGLAALWRAASSPVRAHQRDRSARLRPGVHDEPQARRKEIRHRERARSAGSVAAVEVHGANGGGIVFPASDRCAAQRTRHSLLIQRQGKSAENRSVVCARRRHSGHLLPAPGGRGEDVHALGGAARLHFGTHHHDQSARHGRHGRRRPAVAAPMGQRRLSVGRWRERSFMASARRWPTTKVQLSGVCRRRN